MEAADREGGKKAEKSLQVKTATIRGRRRDDGRISTKDAEKGARRIFGRVPVDRA